MQQSIQGSWRFKSHPITEHSEAGDKPRFASFVVSHFLCLSIMTPECVSVALNCKKKMLEKGDSSVFFLFYLAQEVSKINVVLSC